MTNADIAELRGEIYGLKILLVDCLCFIAAHTTDPDEHLNEILKTAVEGIGGSSHDKVKTAYLRTFQAAAAGIVLQVTEAAKTGVKQVPQRGWLQ